MARYLGGKRVNNATDMVNAVAQLLHERFKIEDLPDAYVKKLKEIYEDIKNYEGLLVLFGNTPDMSAADAIFRKFDELDNAVREYNEKKPTLH